jgi:hypothetical protein
VRYFDAAFVDDRLAETVLHTALNGGLVCDRNKSGVFDPDLKHPRQCPSSAEDEGQKSDEEQPDAMMSLSSPTKAFCVER